MAPSKLRKAIGAVKDQTSIGLAKVGSSASLSDLEVAIVKATRHEEYPAEERHVREILSLTCYSRAFIGVCVNTISRRLAKTKNWVVALKTIMLVHRLLGEGDPAYQQEIFFATRRGTRLLNLSDFRDASRSDSWDYSAFVRTYALYLDEQLEFKMHGRRGKRVGVSDDHDEDQADLAIIKSTPLQEMKNDLIFSRIQHLMQLLERFLACRPTGSAKHNRVILVALYPIVKESFQLYYDITEIQSIMIDRFPIMEISYAIKLYEIFCRLKKQFDDLDQFYDWCKRSGVARSSEYPDVEKITQRKLDVMDGYLRNKSAETHNRNVNQSEYYRVEETEDHMKLLPAEVIEEEVDINAIKALPAPELLPPKEEDIELPKTQTEADLLNLGEDAMTVEEHGDSLALALFDGESTRNDTNGISPWEAFKDSENWEQELVQSASYLGNQKTSFTRGFDMLMLDGMYQQGSTATCNNIATGSGSSMAFGSAGRPAAAMLALPAPPTAAGMSNVDPFAASLAVPPPSYVQMSEMEKKQRLLVEEQNMWQQYSRNGMQGGQINIENGGYNNNNNYVQQNPYTYSMGGGGYTRTY
ncbi:putative clathrin assembly protein At1g03050 [Impatiens glandulifera]|uniref:putative clathrin assembly protein At1g03050 n=1 Tax=Impatiens glandulifera TaxID=253017 RepID=UPI001FB0BD4E|nr:putative clathrin assembly protein At1g03050 [Impatiens glandulifera]